LALAGVSRALESPATPPLSDARERLRWLGQLRWWAMTGAMGGTVVASFSEWSFVSPPGLAGGVALGVLINGALLWRARHVADVGPGELTLHAAGDLLLLTWLLAFSGGLTNPLSVFFSFHVVLGALLSGRTGALTAAAVSLLCVAGLFSLERLGLLPTTPIDKAPQILWLCALALLLGGLTYFALVLAERLRGERLHAIEQRGEAEESLRLLLDSLDALKVGLELVDERGKVTLRNRFAETLRGLPVLGEERPEGPPARFAVPEAGGHERIIDRLTLEPGGRQAAGAFLYVDRTEELLVEQRHMMLERLATLGRALQGVAHELNTPLMTMQTLAKDLGAALAALPLDDEVRRDVDESIALIVEESRRCKGLTQSLLSTAQERAFAEEPAGLTLLAVARRAAQLVGRSAERGEVQLDEESLSRPAPKDPDRVLQVLMNLVQNALMATEEAGRATPVRVLARHKDGALHIVVEDCGGGLPELVRARLFEPFVTTRAPGKGTGLGLYVSQVIARELGGELRLEEREGGGTCAMLCLPAPPPSTGELPVAKTLRSLGAMP
jgi:signal transduction histidine kinase